MDEVKPQDHWTTVGAIKAARALIKAADDLSFAAQITGGTAGRDEALCLAVIHWAAERDKQKQVLRIIELEGHDPEVGVGFELCPMPKMQEDHSEDVLHTVTPADREAYLALNMLPADDAAALADAQPAQDVDALVEENKRLRAMLNPQWFYADGYSSEDCHDSPYEVIEYLDMEPGAHVVQIDCAGPMPSIWCAVRVRTDEEMDADETDDRVEFTEHMTEEAARTALANYRSKP